MEDIHEEILEEASSDQIKEKQDDPLTLCKNDLADMKNRFLYLNAEFDNYKKRISKERLTWAEQAQDQALLDLIAVNDDMERALFELSAQKLPEEAQSHFKGLQIILKSLESTLKKYGIEEIPQSESFDPVFFEAVMQQASPAHKEGDIVAILQKGYQRNGRVLRPAKVSVAS